MLGKKKRTLTYFWKVRQSQALPKPPKRSQTSFFIDGRRLLAKVLNVDDFLYKEETYRILGACFEVYNEKGCGFLEAVYQECLEIELRIQCVPFVARKPIVKYKGETLDKKYEPDVLCFEKIIVKIKSVSSLCDAHRAQLLN